MRRGAAAGAGWLRSRREVPVREPSSSRRGGRGRGGAVLNGVRARMRRGAAAGAGWLRSRREVPVREASSSRRGGRGRGGAVPNEAPAPHAPGPGAQGPRPQRARPRPRPVPMPPAQGTTPPRPPHRPLALPFAPRVLVPPRRGARPAPGRRAKGFGRSCRSPQGPGEAGHTALTGHVALGARRIRHRAPPPCWPVACLFVKRRIRSVKVRRRLGHMRTAVSLPGGARHRSRKASGGER